MRASQISQKTRRGRNPSDINVEFGDIAKGDIRRELNDKVDAWLDRHRGGSKKQYLGAAMTLMLCLDDRVQDILLTANRNKPLRTKIARRTKTASLPEQKKGSLKEVPQIKTTTLKHFTALLADWEARHRYGDRRRYVEAVVQLMLELPDLMQGILLVCSHTSSSYKTVINIITASAILEFGPVSGELASASYFPSA